MTPIRSTGPTTAGNSSQIALEVIVNLYAVVVVVFLGRAVLLLASVDDRVWIGRTLYRFTDPVIDGLRLLPAADHVLVGRFTLADATLLALLALLPLGLAIRRGTAERAGPPAPLA